MAHTLRARKPQVIFAPPNNGTEGMWERMMHMAIISAAKASFFRSRSSFAASRQKAREKGWG